MTMRLDLMRTLLTASVGLALAACSSAATPGITSALVGAAATAAHATQAPAASDDGAGSGSTDGTCGLVTKEAVATAVGFPIATANGAGGICIYQNVDPSKYFSVQLFTGQAQMTTYLSIEASSQHIPGLGDDAFWAGTAGLLFVRKGDHAVVFLNTDWVMTADTDTAHVGAMVTLARTAVPNF